MLKILIVLLLLSPLSLQAESMTGHIQVSLTILPSPCMATSSKQSVTVDCGNITQVVKTTIEKQSSNEKLSDSYLVIITY